MNNKMNSASLKKADLRAALEYMKYNKDSSVALNAVEATSADNTFQRETKKKGLWGSPKRTSVDMGQPTKSILKKTDYSKVKPSLKKYCPDEWGRFLDNHYNPTLHSTSFTVSKKVHEP